MQKLINSLARQSNGVIYSAILITYPNSVYYLFPPIARQEHQAEAASSCLTQISIALLVDELIG